MTINETTGAISWQPVANQTGTQEVTAQATNRVGSDEQTFTITVVTDTIPPSTPANLQVDDVAINSVDLSWTAATDNFEVEYYNVYRAYSCGFRGIKTCYALVKSNIGTISTTVTELPSLTSYKYVVRAVDIGGNQSPNSNSVSFTTLSPPISFQYTFNTVPGSVINIPANSQLQLQLSARANPTATFSLVSGPQSMTIDTVPGLVQWVPTPDDVGVHIATFRATNSIGEVDLIVEITIRPDAPQLSIQFITGEGGLNDAVAGTPYSVQVNDASNTTSTFELINHPPEMTIDTHTGLISWVPTLNDAGNQSVIVRATNAAGFTDISFTFYVHFTGEVTGIQVTGLTDLHPIATWSSPTGIGSDRVAGYTIRETARYRYGRAWRTEQITYESDGTTTSIELTGLASGRAYKLFVNAVDEEEHRGLTNTSGAEFVLLPALPSIGWSIMNANGGKYVIAEQEVIIQLTDFNILTGPSTFSVVDAPLDLIMNSETGEARWTPAASDVGTIPITLRATNMVGPRDIGITLYVYFSGTVQNPYSTRSGTVAFASWDPPIDNVFPVVSYNVTMHWKWSSRPRSRMMTVPATSTSLQFGLIPTGAVSHRGVTIAPVDAQGRTGVSTPLIAYGTGIISQPTPALFAQIEQISIQLDGKLLIEITGDIGAEIQVETSEDMAVWQRLGNSFTLGNSNVFVSDPGSLDADHRYYRLRIIE